MGLLKISHLLRCPLHPLRRCTIKVLSPRGFADALYLTIFEQSLQFTIGTAQVKKRANSALDQNRPYKIFYQAINLMDILLIILLTVLVIGYALIIRIRENKYIKSEKEEPKSEVPRYPRLKGVKQGTSRFDEVLDEYQKKGPK